MKIVHFDRYATKFFFLIFTYKKCTNILQLHLSNPTQFPFFSCCHSTYFHITDEVEWWKNIFVEFNANINKTRFLSVHLYAKSNSIYRRHSMYMEIKTWKSSLLGHVTMCDVLRYNFFFSFSYHVVILFIMSTSVNHFFRTKIYSRTKKVYLFMSKDIAKYI